MGLNVIAYSAVCSFAPPLQAAVQAITHLCISEWNRPTLVERWLNLTHEDLGKLNSSDIGLTSLIIILSLEVFSHHSMLYFYSVHCATLVPDLIEVRVN